MRVAKILPLLTLCLTGSFTIAQEKNCSDLTNPQARQECMKHKSSANVDCSAISDSQARRECAQRKQQNSADCSKLATPRIAPAMCKPKGKVDVLEPRRLRQSPWPQLEPVPDSISVRL